MRACLFLFLASLAFTSLGTAAQISTATGQTISYDDISGVATIEGEAVIQTSSGTLKADRIEMNTQSKEGHAVGNVVIEHASGTVTAKEAFYNWASSTGLIHEAWGQSPPWRFSAEEMRQVGPGVYRLYNGDLTSCDLDPPHYRVRFKRGQVVTGERATLSKATFVTDKTPIFWTPFYTRSLKPRKYSLRVQPGQSSRDGYITRSVLGVPFTPHTYTRFKWDWFERTGNGFGLEHRYWLPGLQGNFDSYHIRDTNPDPQPQSRRWSVLWGHYQRLAPRLTVNSKLDVKSDQTFGNQFSGTGNNVLVENQVRGLLSEAGLNYQFRKAALQAQFDRRDRFDSTVSSESFVAKVTAPRLTFNTIPLDWKYLPFYTSFTGSFVNESLERSDPRRTLRYQRSASSGVQAKRDLRVARWTVTPSAGFSETWQDRDLSTTTEKDAYFGRTNAGVDLRRRFFRLVDLTLAYTHAVRMEKNRSRQDVGANDRGVETERVNSSLVGRLGRSSRLSLSSGYDLLEAPRMSPAQYRHSSSRFSPPTLDLQWQLSRNTNLYFRETYSIFDTRTRRPVNTPLNTSGEIQWGAADRAPFVSQGFSYTKTSPGAKAVLHLTNRLRFYLTPRWYIDGSLSYRAVGGNRLNYHKFFPNEKTIRVVRDMHCWVLRMEFSGRPDRKEASFYIDLKTNLAGQKDVFESRDDVAAPARDPGPDVSTIFPAE